jgi:hypothetical protein
MQPERAGDFRLPKFLSKLGCCLVALAIFSRRSTLAFASSRPNLHESGAHERWETVMSSMSVETRGRHAQESALLQHHLVCYLSTAGICLQSTEMKIMHIKQVSSRSLPHSLAAWVYHFKQYAILRR